MEKEPQTSGAASEIDPQLPESFPVEFLNSKSPEVQRAMAAIGEFSFVRSGIDESGRVFFEGERGDGTKIIIEVAKGENYKSPAELARNNRAETIKDPEQV